MSEIPLTIEAMMRLSRDFVAVRQEFKTGRPGCPDCRGWGHFLAAAPGAFDHLPWGSSGLADGIPVKEQDFIPGGMVFDVVCLRCAE